MGRNNALNENILMILTILRMKCQGVKFANINTDCFCFYFFFKCKILSNISFFTGSSQTQSVHYTWCVYIKTDSQVHEHQEVL